MKKDWMIKESELDDDQIKVLMETLDKSCIVAGCAGSGKSVLALIKAQRVQKEYGNNYKVIVFTKALCNYMNSGKQELGLTNDFYYHQEWKYQRERRGRYMVYSRDENGNMIPYMPSADYIIVDEIQDFSDEELEWLAARRKAVECGETISPLDGAAIVPLRDATLDDCVASVTGDTVAVDAAPPREYDGQARPQPLTHNTYTSSSRK